ncbi:MAG TPA: L-seryl-tRNA(Sec) selenium transferase [Bacteroidales bacterium]|nr:L-seryl-tRNA(Sec) selenium transferase [Bacteroidales bacterium]HRZ20310.1 L-seryl-tRNA(Sec) selenium transferase [Bacteroidales bacterium]
MDRNTGSFKDLPGVDTLLGTEEIKLLLESHSRDLVVFAIQSTLEDFRSTLREGVAAPDMACIIRDISTKIIELTRHSLRKVINATGVIIHTNIGRSPLGEAILDDVREVLTGYSNLEFDLANAKRGSRYSHLTRLLRYLTGAEDVLVVNNNAAAVLLILHTLARRKEVIISRGELIEIGGSFRMPDVMKTSGCRMVEVGTTNKTRLEDYENAITPGTALLMKVHRSNYVIKGFTHQPTLEELVELGKKHSLPVVYDLGSGLIRKTGIGILKDEPDVRQTLGRGVGLVSFSGDKLLGGPQAGIIAGKTEFVSRLKKDPLTRALRVGKTTLALLEAACLSYLDDEHLMQTNPVFAMLHKTPEEIRQKADMLHQELKVLHIDSEVVPNGAQTGGGSLPEAEIPSYAVMIRGFFKTSRERAAFAEQVYRKLLLHDTPVMGILRRGQVLFDVLTIPDHEIPLVARIIHQVIHPFSS